jgi:protoporphyrinogen IX oxidase
VLTYRILVAIHVLANMVWIGSLSAASALLAVRDSTSDRAKDAFWTYRHLAVPAFLLSLLFGGLMLILDPTKSILRVPSMHAKLTLAFGVIAVHHWIGSTARRMASGRKSTGGSIWAFVLLLVFAGGATILGVVRPF